MGVGHENSQQRQLPLHIQIWCPASLLGHIFVKSGYCGVSFLSWVLLEEARQK